MPAWAGLAGCTVACCVLVGGCRAGAQAEQLPERGLWEARLQHPHSLPGSCPTPPFWRKGGALTSRARMWARAPCLAFMGPPVQLNLLSIMTGRKLS